MTAIPRRPALLIAGAAALIMLAAFAWTKERREEFRTRRERPVLLLLSSLPVMFGSDLALEDAGSPLLQALETRYRVEAIATSSVGELARGRLLLMAQPLAQPAENLVALDQWVRGGGRLLLLADPLLEWTDPRALGDPARPPPMFADTGLLGHWGLALDAPERRGEIESSLAGEKAMMVSPGSLRGDCALSADRIVARCAIGKGEAIIVADADFLDWSRGGDRARDRRAVLAALESLESAGSN